jgi:hypothetical protein
MIFLLLQYTSNSFSQSIQLDRPDQTECPFITPKGYIQIENGFVIENENDEKKYSLPSTLWKYGINKRLELRLITAFLKEEKHGLQPITIGFKTSLIEEKGFIPKISFIGHLTTKNIGSKVFYTQYIAPAFRFTMQHNLTEKVSLAYNLGIEWSGETTQESYIYTLTASNSFNKKLGGYIEFYGFFPKQNKPDQRFDCGITYLVNNDFMLDFSGGFGLTPNAPKNYLAFGVSYRFKPE